MWDMYKEKRLNKKNYTFIWNAFATAILTLKKKSIPGNYIEYLAKNFWAHRSVKKVMFAVFRDMQGFISIYFHERGAIVIVFLPSNSFNEIYLIYWSFNVYTFRYRDIYVKKVGKYV